MRCLNRLRPVRKAVGRTAGGQDFRERFDGAEQALAVTCSLPRGDSPFVNDEPLRTGDRKLAGIPHRVACRHPSGGIRTFGRRPAKMQPGGFADFDTKTPSGARVYDYMLGGTDNYVVDRIAADQTEMMMPGTKALARNNRRYMERVVRYLASECGIRQFIDNGSGLPTRNNVDHIAQAIAPESRVVYIDNDPVVLPGPRSRTRPGGSPLCSILPACPHPFSIG